MRIERLEIIGFGNLANKKIEFAGDKLNCVIEGNEYGKSTMADAILAVLYDFPAKQRNTEDKLTDRETRRPLSGQPFKACLDVNCQGRSLRLVRDFAAKTLKVFDRGNADLEITKEFFSGPNQDDAGRKLTGLGRELFKSTCFVGQRDLDDNALSNERRLSSVLQSMADSSGNSNTSAMAVQVLEDTLAGYPHHGKKVRLDKIIRDLEERQQLYRQEIESLEQEKLSVADDLQRLAQLEDSVENNDRQLKSTEHLQLSLELADVDARLANAQERLLKAGDLRQQLAVCKDYKDFPIARQRHVEELWAKRKARLTDLNRANNDLEDAERQLQARDLKLRERFAGLTAFTPDDAGMLNSLARTLQTTQTELQEARDKHEIERKRLEDTGVELGELATVRKSLLNLEAREVDDAYAYQAMIKSAKEQISEIEPSTWRSRMIKTEIEEQRASQAASSKRTAQMLIMLTIVFSIVEGGLFYAQLGTMPLILGGVVCIGLLLSAIWSIISMRSANSHRRADYNKAEEEEQRQSSLGQELHSKIMGLEVRLEGMARKAGLNNGAQLTREIQSYAGSSAQLKDLDLLEHLIDSREAHITKLTSELEAYFKKAGKTVDVVTPELAVKLWETINQYLEELRTLQSSSEMLESKRTQHKFLADELRDMDTEIRDHFIQSKLQNVDDLEKAYREFCQAADSYRQYESLSGEHTRLEDLSSADIVPGDLAGSISRLQAHRNSLLTRIDELPGDNAETAAVTATSTTDALAQADIPALRRELEEIRHEREELRVHVRAATKNYDEHYLETLEAQESIERELQHLRRSKQALELARDTFQRLGKETHAHWAGRLNEISREMLASLGTEYESLHFDEDLDLTARRKGQPEPIQPAQINSQLSTGAREQLHLLARMAVAQFLSKDDTLPIVLDEPFSEADDQRFLNMMRFLIDTVLSNHQIIVFSCHQQRHQALTDALSSEQQAKVQFCELQALD